MDTKLPSKQAVTMSEFLAMPTKTVAKERERKTSSWTTFLRRLAFWKVAKKEKLDAMFIDAVNELHPEWERQRLKQKAVSRH